jgi:hypothetical protein
MNISIVILDIMPRALVEWYQLVYKIYIIFSEKPPACNFLETNVFHPAKGCSRSLQFWNLSTPLLGATLRKTVTASSFMLFQAFMGYIDGHSQRLRQK